MVLDGLVRQPQQGPPSRRTVPRGRRIYRVMVCDARNRDSAKDMLIALVEHAMKSAWGQRDEAPAY